MNPPASTSRHNTTDMNKPRLAFLQSAGHQATAPQRPLFVVEEGTGAARCENGPAYRDVGYVRVIRRAGEDAQAKDERPTISYSPVVAGTDLIYDVTGEFLQGKARPFTCDLSRESERVYAVLPFQMELIAVIAERTTIPENSLAVRVEFQQASGERIVGMLPFALHLLADRHHVAHESWRATDAAGLFADSLRLPKNGADCRWTLVVRSQLDGQEATVEVA